MVILQLVGVFHQLGESDAEASAQLFMEMTRREIEREKQLNKASKRKKKRLLKKSSTISRSSGLTLANPSNMEQLDGYQRQNDNIATARPPRPQRIRPPLAVDGIVTLSAAQRTEFEKMKRQRAHMRSTDSLAAACIFENPAYTHLQEEYHNQQDGVPGSSPVPAQNEYYQQWVQRRRDMEEYRNHREREIGFERSTSPAFSDSGWSHTRTPGLSPESQLDWTYSDLYTIYQSGQNRHHDLPYTLPLQRPGVTSAQPPFFGGSGIRSPSLLIMSDGGYSDDSRHYNYDDTESENGYASIRQEEDNEIPERDTVHVMRTVTATEDTSGNREGELTETSVQRSSQSRVMRSTSSCSSQRHLQELEKIGRDFTRPKAEHEESDLEEGIDKEWEQWIKMQEDE